MSTISIESVTKRFPNGFEALKGISTEIAAGSFTVILGPSGAGKSTLLRLLNGLEIPSGGSIRIAGEALDKGNLRKLRSSVAMVFQQFNLVDRLSVVTNVLTGRLAHRSWVGSVFYLFRTEDMDIAQQALARVGLTDKAWSRADKLSGGQQQRVGIARALAQRPKVILADEPVASLDPVSSEEIMGLLREIRDRDGITVVVNLHQVDLAKRFADRIIGMNSGRVVFDGPPAELSPQALRTIYQREGMEHDNHLDLALAYA
ncbi:phosphonate ABC transporter ATP-binding protein [Thiobacillus denitrificans]|uniref:Phosphonate ABC transporter ATP-binding protein n=1 Tax=Thiobacillus denitrificans TaxID=36861 RepID=A0A106BS05_THIDE|nr:phosphonate ABC transporter ATP-binding protein [Thiobacillus denitrificans]KVW97552.1 phosphonate ABC transporter ATP-binding protein [Thiobacillus denitrificans]